MKAGLWLPPLGVGGALTVDGSALPATVLGAVALVVVFVWLAGDLAGGCFFETGGLVEAFWGGRGFLAAAATGFFAAPFFVAGLRPLLGAWGRAVGFFAADLVAGFFARGLAVGFFAADLAAGRFAFGLVEAFFAGVDLATGLALGFAVLDFG